MSVLEWMKTFALAGVPAGLLLGLTLGLVANRREGWGGYGSLRRRAARLGHVAAVALPLLAGFYALAGGAWPHDPSLYAWGARLWIGGATLLVAVLFLTAAVPCVRYALPIPALAVTGGAAAFALSFLRTQGF